MFKILFIVLMTLILSSCQSSTQQVKQEVSQDSIATSSKSSTPVKQDQKSHIPLTAYDYQIYNAQWQKTSLTKVVDELTQVDVIFIGEYHGNHASHLLQTQLFSELYKRKSELILTLEMFNRDQQGILNDYIDGFIGEKTLINDAPAWPNYKASYRPSVEFAKEHFLPIIAANAAANTVRCIGSQGESYINKLTTEEKSNIAESPFAAIAGYK